MNAQNFQPLLAQHPFSKDFQPKQVERLATLARPVKFAPEQVIFREGDECKEFYLIVSGRVALEMVVGGKVLPIQTLSDGDEFGISALIMRSGTHFQVRALQPVDALLEACRQDPDFAVSMMRQMLLVVSERLDATRLQLMDTYSREAARAGA